MDCPGTPWAASIPLIQDQGHGFHAPKLRISIFTALSFCSIISVSPNGGQQSAAPQLLVTRT